MANDPVLTYAVVEPYAMTSNADQTQTIHDQKVYDRANVVGGDR